MLASVPSSFLCFVLLSSAVLAAPRPIQQRRSECMQSNTTSATVGKAIYFLTNDAENAVVALPISQDGTLSQGTVTKTGGAGSNVIDGSTNRKAMPDALVSQSALTIVGQYLFAVNAGSNTLTMMRISINNATALTIIGQPVSIPGEFPNTVAASTKHELACVGTTGAVAGISCANFRSDGLGQFDCLRPFDLGQTTPPVGPLNTVSQTFFSPNGNVLLTTVKGDPTKNNTGFLSVFPVRASEGSPSQLSTKDVRSSPSGTAVLFGSVPIANDDENLFEQRAFVTDASFGAAVLSLDNKGQASVIGKQAIDGQTATCWATISSKTNSAFVTDVGKDRLVEMSIEDAHIIDEIDLSGDDDQGLVDLKAVGNFVYALSFGNNMSNASVTVLDVSGGQGSAKQVQHFDLFGLAGGNAQGMAALV